MIFKPKISYPRKRAGKPWIYLVLFLISLLFLALAKFLPKESVAEQKEEMLHAAEIMNDALDVLKRCLKERGLEIVEDHDINQTGLIGLEYSSMTTLSIGILVLI